MNNKKNEELQKRMQRAYQKQGRQSMARSQKKRVKKEVLVVKEDQETLDRQRYLGEMISDQTANPAQQPGKAAGK